jgi:two-component system phosphate regulon sensor histidine kinase PhoR
MVVFRIKDDGVGVAKKDLKRIFERFYKADRARAGGGTGLGLSICKHIVESHGGRIWVESEENAGSQFFFTIPVTAGETLA